MFVIVDPSELRPLLKPGKVPSIPKSVTDRYIPAVMKHPSRYQLHTAETRLDLWDALKDPQNPLNKAWPRFLDNDLSQKHFSDSILAHSGLRKFHFAITELDHTGNETMIACGRSVPFFWPELEQIRDVTQLSAHPRIAQTLPDGGWDTIVSRSIRQYLIRQGLPASSLKVLTRDQEQDLPTSQMAHKPNALSALSITVRSDRRRLGLAEWLIEAMRQSAREEHLRVLVAPLRPTRKSDHPFISMEKYVTWTHARNLSSKLPYPSSEQITHNPMHPELSNNASWELPFDPWLRKHVHLGGRVVKIAPRSMVVQGSITEWQGWTGIDFHRLVQEARSEDLKSDPGSHMMYLEVPVPGGLVPLKVHVAEKTCAYVEPNVWLYHEIQ